MDNLDDGVGPEIEDYHLEMPGAAIIGHRTKSEPRDDDAWRGKKKPSYEEMRAALDLDPDCPVARVFEVTAERTPDNKLLREMRYFDGVVPRIAVTMDEDNQVQVAVFCRGSGALRRYSLDDLATLGDLAKRASDLAVKCSEQAQQAANSALENLELARNLGADNDRLRAEVNHLRKLLGDRAPEPSSS